jgi:DNA-binding beta-propeller fold protein YncE
MKIKNTIIGTLILGMFVVTSCADLPQAEMDAAIAAVAITKAAGADIYVTDQFNSLNDSMAVAMADLEAQKSKFFKKYSTTIEKFNGVVAFAGEVEQNTVSTIETINSEIVSSTTEIQTLVAQGRQLMTEAPTGKEGRIALEAIKTELDVVEGSINESATMAQGGNLKPALEKLTAAKSKASTINSELTEVISKYKAAPRR